MVSASWLPVERKTTHPADVAAGRIGLGCAVPMLYVIGLPYLIMMSGPLWPIMMVLLAVVGVLLPLAFWIGSRWHRSQRVAQAFADLGPRDEDMVEVWVQFRRNGVPLGSDYGYLWPGDGMTSFQGSRVAFRVGGPAWGKIWHDVGRIELVGPGDERVLVERWRKISGGAGELPIALDGTGPVTPPPLVCDPGMRPPTLVWRAPLAVAATLVWAEHTSALFAADWLNFLLVWLFETAMLGWVMHLLLSPVFRDRRGRGG